MTRKGKLPIPVPSGVEVKVQDGLISVKGPKGHLEQAVKDGISVKVEEKQIVVGLSKEDDELRKFQGLYRQLIENMVVGTTKGFEKKLEMIGVGYRAAVQGSDVNLQVGLSHPTLIPIPNGLSVKVDKNTQITITGFDKQLVGQFASTLRAIRPPEPYQGKGIRYVGEYVRRKAGKSASKK